MTERTHLYLDIDGVLNAYAALVSEPRYRAWPDYRHTNPVGEVVSPLMVGDLNALIAIHKLEVFWLTTWENTAPAWGQKIGLLGAENWPWLDTGDIEGKWGKFHSIKEHLAFTGAKHAIWIDDDLKDEHDAAAWAADSGILALAPYGAHGITPAMIKQINTYAMEACLVRTSD